MEPLCLPILKIQDHQKPSLRLFDTIAASGTSVCLQKNIMSAGLSAFFAFTEIEAPGWWANAKLNSSFLIPAPRSLLIFYLRLRLSLRPGLGPGLRNTFTNPSIIPLYQQDLHGLMFGHEKFGAYKLSIEFVALSVSIIESAGKDNHDLIDQLKRASISIPLNIAPNTNP